jgi:putative ABC transport system permease protein
MDVDPKAWEDFLAKRNGALLGTDLVNRYKDEYVWEVGKEFAIADFDGLSLFMAGEFIPRDSAYKSVILADRVYLQEVDALRGICHQLFVKIDDRKNSNRIAAAIDDLDFPVKPNTESAQVALDQAFDDLNDMLRYAGYVIIFTVLVIFLCIANTISMSTYDRTQEIGVLRSMGFERSRIMQIVLAESVLLSLLGGVLGCGAAFLVLELAEQVIFLRGVAVPIVMRPVILSLGIGASLLVGLLGGILPAFNASRLNIVKSLRNVE